MTAKIGYIGGLAIGSFDADTGFPTLDFSDGNGAAVSHAGHARIRFNLSTQQIEQSINTGAWIAFATGGSAASALAKFIVQQPDGTLPNAQALSALGTGLVKNTTTTGLLSIAIANTDFPAVTAQYLVASATAAPPNAQNLGILSSGILKQTVSAGVATIAIAQPGIDTLGPKFGEYWVYLVDYDGVGNDITGAVGIANSMASALSAAVPFKTLERIGQLIPRQGSGATLVVLVKPRTAGATYRNMANSADQDGSWLNGLSGWHFLARGSLDFLNDTNDKIGAGFLTQTGTNAPGYKVSSLVNSLGSSTLTCALAGGGAPGFTAESGGFSAITGLRIRFLSTTTTVALQNFCVGIEKNTTTTLGTMATLPATPLPPTDPSGGDIFVIETPGVAVGTLTHFAGSNRTFCLVGFNCTATSNINHQSTTSRIAGCRFTTVNFNNGETYTALTSYADEADATITVGFAFRASVGVIFNSTKAITVFASSWLGATQISIGATVLSSSVGGGCVTVQGYRNNNTFGASVTTIGNLGSGTIAQFRITGANIGGTAGIHCGGIGARIFGVDFSNCTTGCVALDSANAGAGKYYLDGLTSTDGGNVGSASPNESFVLRTTGIKQEDGMTVFVGTVSANTAVADRDILSDGGVRGRFSDLARQNLVIRGIHIYGGTTPAFDYFNDSVVGPTTLMETHNTSFYGNGPFPPFRVWNFIGYPNGPGTVACALPAIADTFAHCQAIAGVSLNYVWAAGDYLSLAQAGPVKIEFAPGSLGLVTGGEMAYLSELGGSNSGKARVGIPTSGIVVPLGPIQATDYGVVISSGFAMVNLTCNSPITHAGLSIPARTVSSSGVYSDLIATASGQFLRRDGNNTLGFGAITTADLPISTTAQIGTVINNTALSNINVSGVNESIQFVETYKDFFHLDKKTTRVFQQDVVVSGNVPNSWWVRMNISDPYWATKGFVSIDSINGNDQNIGFADTMIAADAVPLKTFAELNRRLPEAGLTTDMVCHVINSIPDDQEDDMILTRLKIQSYDSRFVIIGALSSAARPAVFTGTVGGYVAAVPSVNTKRQLTLSGAPAGIVGKFIQKSDGTKSAYILADLGGGAYRIKYPVSADSLTGSLGSGVEFVNGETIVIYDLPTLPIYPFPGAAFTRDIEDSPNAHPGNLILSNFKIRSPETDERASIELGSSPSRLVNCILVDPFVTGGINSVWSNVLFAAADIGLSFMSGINFLTLFSCALLNTQILTRHSAFNLTLSLDIEGNSAAGFAHLYMQQGYCSIASIGCEIAMFNSASAMILGLLPTCSFNSVGSTSSLYGTNNTNNFYNMSFGSRWSVRKVGQFATSSSPPININGTGYNYSDIPVSLAFSQATLQDA